MAGYEMRIHSYNIKKNGTKGNFLTFFQILKSVPSCKARNLYNEFVSGHLCSRHLCPGKNSPKCEKCPRHLVPRQNCPKIVQAIATLVNDRINLISSQ